MSHATTCSCCRLDRLLRDGVGSVWVEVDGSDRFAVADRAAPALGVAATGRRVDFLAGGEDVGVASPVPSVGRHTPDAAVEVDLVVPVHEACDPSATSDLAYLKTRLIRLMLPDWLRPMVQQLSEGRAFGEYRVIEVELTRYAAQ